VQGTVWQPWWLGYLDTGATDIVFPDAPRLRLYQDWPYVFVQAGPKQALTWRTGHLLGQYGALPEILFPEDRSWVLSTLWDDTWSCFGGPIELVQALEADALLAARRVDPGQDMLPPGLQRE
jgi:hypothetical protein